MKIIVFIEELDVIKRILRTLISGMFVIMICRKRFQMVSLSWSAMRQTLRFRNWRVGIDFFEIGLRDCAPITVRNDIFRVEYIALDHLAPDKFGLESVQTIIGQFIHDPSL